MFGNLLKAVVGVATLPVSVVADAVTLGGVLTDRNRTYTGKNLSQVVKNLEKAVESN